MVAADDASGVTIPYAMFPSKDEPKEDVEAWQKNIKVKNVVRWWPNQVSVAFEVCSRDCADGG